MIRIPFTTSALASALPEFCRASVRDHFEADDNYYTAVLKRRKTGSKRPYQAAKLVVHPEFNSRSHPVGGDVLVENYKGTMAKHYITLYSRHRMQPIPPGDYWVWLEEAI